MAKSSTHSLSPVQFNILVELEQEMARMEEMVNIMQRKREVAFALILDSLKLTGATEAKFDKSARTIVVTIPEAQPV